MSFEPSSGMVNREAYGGREVEAELITEHYAETHPGDGIHSHADSGLRGLLKRLRDGLSRRRDSNDGPGI